MAFKAPNAREKSVKQRDNQKYKVKAG